MIMLSNPSLHKKENIYSNSYGRCRTKPALILNSDRRHVFQIIIGNWKIDLKFQLCVKKSMKEVLKALMYYGSTGVLILMYILWLHHQQSPQVCSCVWGETWERHDIVPFDSKYVFNHFELKRLEKGWWMDVCVL